MRLTWNWENETNSSALNICWLHYNISLNTLSLSQLVNEIKIKPWQLGNGVHVSTHCKST